jgi:adhesin/invasin
MMCSAWSGSRNVNERSLQVRALACIAAAFGAAMFTMGCNSSDSNTVPLVATTITASTGASGQTGVVGTALAAAVSVHVVDQNGNPFPAAVVTWTPAATSGSVAASTSSTDASGNATALWTLGTVSGTDSLTASLPSGASTVIVATAGASAFSSLTLVSGNAQQIVSGGTSAALIVKAVDQFGNPVPGATVNWTTTGSSTLSSSSTTTDATGTTSVTLTTGPSPATYTVTAASGAATPVAFTVTGT